MSSRVAIIPARGGSKRIPGKNIRDFLGKPIIAYSIEAAIQSNLFDEVMVSTDDEKIGEVAQSYGAEVPFIRSNETANDFATTYDVLNEVLEEYHKKGIMWDQGCCIYSTAPFTTPAALKEGLDVLMNLGFDSVFPIVPFDYPIWRGLVKEDGRIKMKWEEHLNSRSQDLEPVYHDAGQWYWFQTKKLLEQKKLFSGNSGYIELNATRAHDIDTEEDWKIAELKYNALRI
ncbi:MAG: pseudaminic acid cytidylyltransferase [Cyclobacteriaceae bacterium]